MKKIVTLLLVSTLAAGCSVGNTDTDTDIDTSTSLSIPPATSVDTESAVHGMKFSDSLQGGMGWKAGSVLIKTGYDDYGANAHVGLDPYTVGVEPSADMSYSGTYRIFGIEDITVTDGVFSGTRMEDSGWVSLLLNATEGSVTGSDTSLNGSSIVVDGSFAGNELTGLVNYAGKQMALEGKIGDVGIIGGFHASTDTGVYAGGLLGLNITD